MSMEAVLKHQVIERAWKDPSFKQLLMKDPKTALREALGIELPESFKLRTVEEREDEFFLVIPPDPSRVVKSEVRPLGYW